MSQPGETDVTRLLARWNAGDSEAVGDLLPLVYDELRRLARSYLRKERAEHTLQPTALVHEAYLKLVGKDHPSWKDRAHFFAVAAKLMRRILVDHARSHQASKATVFLLDVYRHRSRGGCQKHEQNCEPGDAQIHGAELLPFAANHFDQVRQDR